MPRINLTKDTKKMLCSVFSVFDNSEIQEKCIIFDSKRNGTTLLSQEQMTLLDQCYRVVINCVGNDNSVLKPHPRSSESCSINVKTYPNQGIPMEVLYAGMSDIQDRILVSFVSTAVFTPKILYDVEPIIICLHQIAKENQISKNFESIFEKFRGIYNNKERVLAPTSIEELEAQLKWIAG